MNTNPVGNANSGMNKLADTAAQMGSSTSSGTTTTTATNTTSSSATNSNPNATSNPNASGATNQYNHNSFLEADASFASATPSSQVVTSFNIPQQVPASTTGSNINNTNGYANSNGQGHPSHSHMFGVGVAQSTGSNTTNHPASGTTATTNTNNTAHTTTTTVGVNSPYGSHATTSAHGGNTSFATSLSNAYSAATANTTTSSVNTTPTSVNVSVSSTGGGSTNPPSAKRKKTSAKQHQLPMFLTKTYHMIDRCDHEVALWADDGESFVVKNVEKFATNVLPQYFKHSNFSSFARQLNFYGFRKLKAEPILTADYDARTASYVRFYHEHFQKGKPELLCHIKRATKSDVQSKDDVDQLRLELQHTTEAMNNLSIEFERKLTEITFTMNSKIAALHAKIDELQMNAMNQQRVFQQQMHALQVNAGKNNVGGGVGVSVGGRGQQQQQQGNQQVTQQSQPPQTQQQRLHQQQQSQHQQQQVVQQQQQQMQVQVTSQPHHQQQVQQQVVKPEQVQQQQQYIQTQVVQNNVSGGTVASSGNKMGGLLAAGLAIKSPALPSQQGHPHAGRIPSLTDNLMLPPAQK